MDFCRRILDGEPSANLGAHGRHNRRVRHLLVFGGIVTLLVSLPWTVAYTWQGNLLGAAITLVAFLSALGMVLLAAYEHLRAAGMLMAHGLLGATTLACLADSPLDGVARSQHFNLLPLAAAIFLVFAREGIYMRIVLPILALALYLGCSLDFVPPLLLQPGSQGVNSVLALWSNTLSSTIGLATVIVLMQSNISSRRALENDIRRAIARGEFQLYYQKQVDADGRMTGVEALLRWPHPTRGMVPPKDFIPLAEETGLIVPIGAWVLRQAASQLQIWAASPQTAHLTIAVNVSASQFRQPDFVEQVTSILALSGARPQALKLELTESVLADDLDTVRRKMQALTALGISWSLDDFGTGYSSLSSLKHLPFRQVKIDQSFVRDLLGDPRNMAIVETILRLSQSLDLCVIAEGVENEAQRAALTKAGCRHFQGYLFGRPVPVEHLDNQPLAA